MTNQNSRNEDFFFLGSRKKIDIIDKSNRESPKA